MAVRIIVNLLIKRQLSLLWRSAQAQRFNRNAPPSKESDFLLVEHEWLDYQMHSRRSRANTPTRAAL